MSEQLKVRGTIYRIGETEVVSDKFKKRELVLKTDGEYPQYVPIQFTQDKCNSLDKYSNGDVIEVSFNLRGRMWTDKSGVEKCFGNIEGWKIETVGQSVQAAEEKSNLPF